MIRVIIADGHILLQEGLAALIDGEPDMAVVGRALDLPEILPALEERPCDVLLVSAELPSGSGLSIVEPVKAASPHTLVAVLAPNTTGGAEPAFLAAGVDALLSLRDPAEALFESLRRLAAGRAKSAANGGMLSPREGEVLALIAHGFTSRDIADRLDLSVKTVEGYRGRIRIKLGAKSRADLVREARRRGMLEGFAIAS